MASFEQHVNFAVITAGIAVVPLFSGGLVTLGESVGLFSLGILGGILPDVDSDNSKPIQISFRILSIFLPLLAILLTLKSSSISTILLMWLFYSLILHFGVFRLFLAATHHRGIFHSIPMGVFLSLLLFYLLVKIFHYTALFSLLCGVLLLYGFLIHLLLDEFVSLNLLGKHMKKSFGSAMKLYDKNNPVGTVFLYMAIALLLFLNPIDPQLFSDIGVHFRELKY